MELRTTNLNSQAMNDIPKLGQRFYSENVIEKIPNKTDNDVLGLYVDYEIDYTKPYSLIIGCKVSKIDSVPQGMVAKTVPAVKYAVFNAAGKFFEKIAETRQQIWNTNFSEHTRAIFEVYDCRFNSDKPGYLHCH